MTGRKNLPCMEKTEFAVQKQVIGMIAILISWRQYEDSLQILKNVSK